MKTNYTVLSTDEKRTIIEDAVCTLNGHPAKIQGAVLIFAIVHNELGQSAQFSWNAVTRILATGGHFES